MRLTRVVIKNYKHLKNIVLEIPKEDEWKDFPVYFCIGLNGSGKSTFLEALALIFSRISQDELPGFDFEVEYDIFCDESQSHVRVTPQKDRTKGRLCIKIDDMEPITSFNGYEQYLPYKVITYVSGANSQMKQLVQEAAEDSIISDIYDAAKNDDTQLIDDLLKKLAALGSNPRILYLDEELAALILFVLCAWSPKEDSDYGENRKLLFQKLSEEFSPKVLALNAGNDIESSLFAQFFTAKTDVEESGFADWISKDEDSMTAGFRITGGDTEYCVERIRASYTNPLQLLTVMLQARNRGELKEWHVQFQSRRRGDFLNEVALSDGELLWVARMGLVLLAGQAECKDCLFLLDEPDVHLNESWNVEFVSGMEQFSGGNDSKHNFWVATHSSLLLTDALPNHVFRFERKGQEALVKRIPISFFGASRSEISQNAFANSAHIGVFAQEKIQKVLEDDISQEELWRYIDTVGAGIERFRLLDKYYEEAGE